MKIHIFNAGPCVLPQEVLEASSKATLELNNSGMSLLEVSHRSADYIQIHEEAKALLRELLDIPSSHKVLFLGGGASTQFFHIPYNLLETKAGYVNTGVWATKAIEDAELFGETVVVASSEDKNFSYIPKGFDIPTDLDYLHITTNNTIYGTEYRKDIESPVQMVADMSSDILTRPIDFSNYAIVYGGAQKNMGPAGVTFVIVREDVLGKVSRKLPAMVDYRKQIKADSIYNTPPVFPIFVVNEVLKWVKAKGGVPAMQKRAEERANLLYDEIDRNKLFMGTAVKEDRSLMNICFVMNDKYEHLTDEFIKYTKEHNITGIKGHRLVGGFRVSNYNALEMESMEVLVNCMKEFEKKHA